MWKLERFVCVSQMQTEQEETKKHFPTIGFYMSLVVRKLDFGVSDQFPTRSYTNRTVQPQKMVRSLKFQICRTCTICVAKTKALISCEVTVQLICVFVVRIYKKPVFS